LYCSASELEALFLFLVFFLCNLTLRFFYVGLFYCCDAQQVSDNMT